MKYNFKVSIIVVSLNTKKKFTKTINSILKQKYKNFEIVVIDGKSTDGTKEIIFKKKKYISKFLIKKDKGIYHAMNKGVSLAKGDIIGFLNSDDTYFENSLNIVNNYFSNNKIDFLFGSVEKYKLMHGFKPWKIKWSFGFYTSHSVGFL